MSHSAASLTGYDAAQDDGIKRAPALARAKLPREENAAPHHRDSTIEESCLFTAYLREYRAKILESAGWSQCSPERGKLCDGHINALGRL